MTVVVMIMSTRASRRFAASVVLFSARLFSVCAFVVLGCTTAAEFSTTTLALITLSMPVDKMVSLMASLVGKMALCFLTMQFICRD
jgi:hypothetical protein